MHFLLGDLAVLGLVGSQEFIDCGQPAVVIGLQAQGIVHPRAHALGPAMGNRLLGGSNQLSVNRRRQPLLCAHTLMLRPCHSCRMAPRAQHRARERALAEQEGELRHVVGQHPDMERHVGPVPRAQRGDAAAMLTSVSIEDLVQRVSSVGWPRLILLRSPRAVL